MHTVQAKFPLTAHNHSVRKQAQKGENQSSRSRRKSGRQSHITGQYQHQSYRGGQRSKPQPDTVRLHTPPGAATCTVCLPLPHQCCVCREDVTTPELRDRTSLGPGPCMAQDYGESGWFSKFLGSSLFDSNYFRPRKKELTRLGETGEHL